MEEFNKKINIGDFRTSENCPICTETNNNAKTGCHHYFHKDCLYKWMITDNHLNCPMCRMSLCDMPDIIYENTNDIFNMILEKHAKRLEQELNKNKFRQTTYRFNY